MNRDREGKIVKILLIEDDTVDGMFFSRSLKTIDVNCDLTIKEDAVSGINAFNSEYFDCVFLDYLLPGTDGVSVLKKLREKEDSSIVLITSHGDEKVAVEAMKAGALDYISKGLITPESLEKTIRNVLRFRDTQKQKAEIEEAFRQSEKRYRIFFEKSQGFFCTHDSQGNFITVNDAGAQSIGYSPKELIGMNVRDILSPSTKHFFDIYLNEVLSNKSASGLMKVITKNGEERVWSYKNSLYKESKENYIIGSVQDITDRIKMEEAQMHSKRLAEESERIKKLVNELDVYSSKLRESINYAKRLQDGIYSGKEKFRTLFRNAFIINRPKEIVSGDFYWFGKKNNKLIVALADCTGHGVPGALLSTLGYTMLNNIILNSNDTSPAKILENLWIEWDRTFDRLNNRNHSCDGMEISLCVIDYESKTLFFSGMGGLLFLVKEENLLEYKGEKTGISLTYHIDTGNASKRLINQQISFDEKDRIYLFSDGYRDQFGGSGKNEKLTKKGFKDLIQSIQEYSMEKQKQLMDESFLKWKGDIPQTDDVLVMGIEL